MKVLKFLLIFVLCTIVINGVVYSCGAFIVWEPNVGMWSDGARLFLALMFYIGIAVAGAIGYGSTYKAE